VRTTVTLDDDLVKKVKDFAHRSRASFKVALGGVSPEDEDLESALVTPWLL
jgi:predicted transcriptional regulator